MATLQSPKDHIVDLVVDVVALRSVHFTKEIGWQKVKFEGDALQVVQVIKQVDTDLCQLIDDARKLLNSFQQWGVFHVR